MPIGTEEISMKFFGDVITGGVMSGGEIGRCIGGKSQNKDISEGSLYDDMAGPP